MERNGRACPISGRIVKKKSKSMPNSREFQGRDSIVRVLWSGSSRVLIPTDLLAIDIDVLQVPLVINFDCTALLAARGFPFETGAPMPRGSTANKGGYRRKHSRVTEAAWRIEIRLCFARTQSGSFERAARSS